jgi:HSP20 family protein
MVNIQDQMNRLFNDLFSQSPERLEEGQTVWSPLVDISENENEVKVQAEIPGMKKDDVNITIQDNVLTIRGEKKQEKVDKEKNYHRVERCYGTFQRSFTLPTAIQADGVKAKYDNGVLTVILPKAEEAKAKQVAIEVK